MHKLLGYANLIQGEMLSQCEQITTDANPEDRKNLSPENQQQQKNTHSKWQLLFQLDTIQTPENPMIWGDVGRLYFYINVDDLKNQNFDNPWLILQCH